MANLREVCLFNDYLFIIIFDLYNTQSHTNVGSITNGSIADVGKLGGKST